MKIIISIKDKKIEIALRQGRKILDRVDFLEKCNLTDELLLTIDGLLTRNNIKPLELEAISVRSNLGEAYTSTRIAKVTAKTFNWLLSGKLVQ